MRYKPPKKERVYSVEEMLEMRKNGVTLRELGEMLGVSKQRVQQIVGYTRDIKPRKYYPTKEERIENKKKSAIDRFWSRVDARNEDDCWNWTGTTNKIIGYGRMSFMGTPYYTHRLAYILTQGSIPPGATVLHSCDNQLCCNPKHLRIGTQTENVADRNNKLRTRHTDKYKVQREFIVNNCKTGDDIVRVAKKLNVTPMNVYTILCRARRHVSRGEE